MNYNKLCNKCGVQQTYSRLGNYNRAIKNNTLCRACRNKEVSWETKEKMSRSSIGKPKTKEHTEKMKNSLTELWKNKSIEELNNWKKVVSKTSLDRWQDPDYKNKVSNSIKKHWDTLSDEERCARFISQQENGAGVCKYIKILDYLVYGQCEKRYIEYLYKNNSALPIKKKRLGIKTPFGMCFPDFEFESYFVEIKSTYTFNKMIEQAKQTKNSQLSKLIWISNNIKNVNILVETSKNKFEDKSKELTLLKAREEANLCHYSGLRTVESYHILEDF